MRLGLIAQVLSGIPANTHPKRQGKLQKRQINRLVNYKPIELKQQDIYRRVITDDYYLKSDDIILPLVIYHKEIKAYRFNYPMNNLLAPANSCIVRVVHDHWKPEFVRLYLETQAINQLTLTQHKNPTCNKIPLTQLRNLELPDISLIQQENILGVISYQLGQAAYLQAQIGDLEAQIEELETDAKQTFRSYL